MKYRNHYGFNPEYPPSPHGEGGLKFVSAAVLYPMHQSLPTRGGWIEIGIASATVAAIPGPSPHGEGGLKCVDNKKLAAEHKVPPHTGRVD